MKLHPFAAGLSLLALGACADMTARAPAVAVPAVVPAAPPVAQAPAGPRRAVPIFFEPNSAAIGGDAMDGLKELATLAKGNPRTRILVVGHAAPRGTSEANQLLSRLRARVVKDALVAEGIPASRLRVIARGSADATDTVASRRVDVRVDDGRN